ncbi:hypothetical protein PO002_27700 [Cupriavidus necator]|uniref:hypothetical protein n=1 Tax=Cupriavidus necator TaxID=106590 RepID=UPI0039C31B1B
MLVAKAFANHARLAVSFRDMAQSFGSNHITYARALPKIRERLRELEAVAVSRLDGCFAALGLIATDEGSCLTCCYSNPRIFPNCRVTSKAPPEKSARGFCFSSTRRCTYSLPLYGWIACPGAEHHIPGVWAPNTAGPFYSAGSQSGPHRETPGFPGASNWCK